MAGAGDVVALYVVRSGCESAPSWRSQDLPAELHNAGDRKARAAVQCADAQTGQPYRTTVDTLASTESAQVQRMRSGDDRRPSSGHCTR